MKKTRAWILILALFISGDHLQAQMLTEPAMQQFVSKLYTSFTYTSSGEPKPADVAAWVAELKAAGKDFSRRRLVIMNFLTRTHFSQVLVSRWYEAMGVAPASPHQMAKSWPKIPQLAAKLRQGVDYRKLHIQMLSDEKIFRLPLSRKAFVNKAYLSILGRLPLQKEKRRDVAALTGTTEAKRRAFARGLLRSKEFASHLVDEWFQVYLNRHPLPAERVLWEFKLGRYGDYLTLLSDFLACNEYFGFPRPTDPTTEHAIGPYFLSEQAVPGPKPSFDGNAPLVITTLNPPSGDEDPTNRNLVKKKPARFQPSEILSNEWGKMTEAGVDVVAVNYLRPLDGQLTRADKIIRWAVGARERLLKEGKKAPFLAMGFDGRSFLPQNNSAHMVGELRSERGQAWLHHLIKSFYSLVPPRDWARQNGQPILLLHHLEALGSVDPDLFLGLDQFFNGAFGVSPKILKLKGSLVEYVTQDPDLIKRHSNMILLAGMRSEESFGKIIARDEFFSLAGSGERDLVSALFQKILWRSPAPPELDYWSERVKIRGRAWTTEALLHEEESLRVQVVQWAQKFWGSSDSWQVLEQRPAIRAIATRLRANEDRLKVLASFLQSKEYLEVNGQKRENLVEDLYQKLLGICLPPGEKSKLMSEWGGSSTEPLIADLLWRPEATQIMVAEFIQTWKGFGHGPLDIAGVWGATECPQFYQIASLSAGTQKPVRQLASSGKASESLSYYRSEWDKLLERSPRPQFVHLETWNFSETPIPFAEKGKRGDALRAMTMKFATQFKGAFQSRWPVVTEEPVKPDKG